jgi:hypothetical protein
MSSLMNVTIGAPHFKSIVKLARNNGYTMDIIIPEILDYPILNAKNIDISIVLDNNKLYKIKISDDCPNGFENILSNGAENPLNFGHHRSGHDDDNDISEFGGGGKQASSALANKIAYLTKVPSGKCIKAILDIPEMMDKTDINESYKPTSLIFISQDEYTNDHPYATGSTVLLEEILYEVYKPSSMIAIENDLKKIISRSYSKIIKDKGLNITINSVRVEPDDSYFEKAECVPFNEIVEILIKKDTDGSPVILEKNVDKYSKYNSDTKKFNQMNPKESLKILAKEDYFETGFLNDNNVMLFVKGTGLQFIKGLDDLPCGDIHFYKLDRFHGKQKTNSNNGSKNYVYIELCLKSKALGKCMGASYNKTLGLIKDNDITNAILASIVRMRSKLEYDTSTTKAEKIYKLAIDNGIVVSADKLPTKIKKSKEAKELQDAKEAKELQDAKEAKELQDAKEAKELQDAKDAKELQDATESEELQDDTKSEESQDVGEAKDSEYTEKSQDMTEAKESQDDTESKGSQDSGESEEPQDVVEPKTRELGPGKQLRQTKKNVISILEKEISEKMKILSKPKLECYKADLCRCLEDMIMESINRNETKYEHHYRMAIEVGFKVMIQEYYKTIDRRLDDDDVCGGSILTKFMRRDNN